MSKRGDPRHNGSIRRRYRARALAELRENGGKCWLCGEHIDLARRWPDPLCFVADHVTPYAVSGDPHGQTKPAHKVCNERRGSKTAGMIGHTSRDW